MSLDGGEGSAEQAAVLRYSPEKVKHHILAAMKKKDGMFRGVEALKRAAEEGHPSLLRKGQIIFGTVSIASYKKAKGSFRGWIYNTLAPVLTLATVGQKRTFSLRSERDGTDANLVHYHNMTKSTFSPRHLQVIWWRNK